VTTRATKKPRSPAEAGATLPAPEPDALRRQLAGLSAPPVPSESEAAEFRPVAARLCVALARHYGLSDDRIRMWEHIDQKALRVASGKVWDGDLLAFWETCLDALRGNRAAAARCPIASQLVAEFEGRGREWGKRFIAYVRRCRAAVVTFGWVAWQEYTAARRAVKRSG
jgi:hypothetical protein